MIRDEDHEEEDEKSGSVNALNNKEQQLGLCGIQNIAIQRHPPKEGTVPSDIIQESVAMNIQEQSLRMIRDQDEEEEDEKSVNALNNKDQQLGLCGIQNIAIQRHPPKEGTVPSDNDIIQESVAMALSIDLDMHLNADMSAPTTCNNRRQTESRDRRRVPCARPYRQLRRNEQQVTTNTFNGDVTAPNTCNNRRQNRDRLRVACARPNRQLQLDEQPATTSENKKITLVYGLLNPKSASCFVDTPYSPTTFGRAGNNNIQQFVSDVFVLSRSCICVRYAGRRSGKSNIESGSDVDELCSMTSLNGPRILKLSSVCEEVQPTPTGSPAPTVAQKFGTLPQPATLPVNIRPNTSSVLATISLHAFSTGNFQEPAHGVWNMDTCVSSHFNNSVHSLSENFNTCMYSSISVGDGHSIPVANKGHSILPSPFKSLHLNYVLITSSIVKNLISVRQFVRDNNCTIEFDAFGFSVKDFMTRRVLLRCDSTGDLYPVTAPSPIPHAFLVSQHTSHQCLGHPEGEMLRRLVSSNFISYNKEKPPILCHALPRPPDTNIVRCIWLFRHKYLANGTLSRYKARLVENDSTQLEGVDVDETFSPVVKPGTIWTFPILATSRHWLIHQLDVKNAFLYGDLSETVYTHQPPGFRDSVHSDSVCVLQRPLYGQKRPPELGFSVLHLILLGSAFLIVAVLYSTSPLHDEIFLT
nr:ribonuclease H-like domain-containing protein [Tanacetum cinerariifolium]